MKKYSSQKQQKNKTTFLQISLKLALCLLFILLSLVGCQSKKRVNLSVAPRNIDLTTGGKSLEISNTGDAGSSLGWSIAIVQNDSNPQAGEWFSLSRNKGTLANQQSDSITLVPKQQLPQGKYQATLHINVTAGELNSQTTSTQTVKVSGEIFKQAQSCIAPTPTTQYLPIDESARDNTKEILVRYHDTANPIGQTRGSSLTNTIQVAGIEIDAYEYHTYMNTTKRLEQRHNITTTYHGYGLVPDVITVAKDTNTADMVAQLNQDPSVRYATANANLALQGTLPNDPLYKYQWHLEKNFGIPEAWEIETGKNTSIIVAIIDSSFEIRHEDLVDRLLPGCDIFNLDDDPSPGPFNPKGLNLKPTHGTHVAGIVAATGNNRLGVTGVAYAGVKLLPVKIFNDAGDKADISHLTRGIRWSLGLTVPGLQTNPNPAKIINLSLGMNGNNPAINEAVAEARNAGALVVAATGNQNYTDAILTPANAPGALAVAAVNSDYSFLSFSNYNQNEDQVDLVAPGGLYKNENSTQERTFCPKVRDAIVSTFATNTYGCLGGTSMAAPFVSGVAALIWSQNPSLNDKQIEARLLASTLKKPEWDKAKYGAGLICADRALGAPTLCGTPPTP